MGQNNNSLVGVLTQAAKAGDPIAVALQSAWTPDDMSKTTDEIVRIIQQGQAEEAERIWGKLSVADRRAFWRDIDDVLPITCRTTTYTLIDEKLRAQVVPVAKALMEIVHRTRPSADEGV